MPSPTPPSRLFRGGRLFDGTQFLDATDLRCGPDGRITEIGTRLVAQLGEEVVELDGRWLLPGLVDCHVHFREPGLVRKEGYGYGSSGALHGGVTTVCEIQNNPPLMDSLATLKTKLENLRGISRVDYAPYGSLVEESLDDLEAMKKHCPAVKCFLGCSTGSGGVADEATLRRWFGAAAKAGIKVVAHCEDNDVMDAATEALKDDPEKFTRHDLRRSREAEVVSIDSAIAIAAEVGAILHVFHISTFEGAARVTTAAARGMAVTGSTAPHYLLATADDTEAAAQNRFKVNPAIKYEDDRAGIGNLVCQGMLPIVGTDHAPHPLDEKDRPYQKAPSGFPSIDLLLPLMFAAADLNQCSSEPFLHAVTQGPADEFALAQKGRLAVGADADLVVVDPSQKKVVDETTLLSRSGWSPYVGWELRGFPQQVYLRGNLVFEDGATVGAPIGQPLMA